MDVGGMVWTYNIYIYTLEDKTDFSLSSTPQAHSITFRYRTCGSRFAVLGHEVIVIYRFSAHPFNIHGFHSHYNCNPTRVWKGRAEQQAHVLASFCWCPAKVKSHRLSVDMPPTNSQLGSKTCYHYATKSFPWHHLRCLLNFEMGISMCHY